MNLDEKSQMRLNECENMMKICWKSRGKVWKSKSTIERLEVRETH